VGITGGIAWRLTLTTIYLCYDMTWIKYYTRIYHPNAWHMLRAQLDLSIMGDQVPSFYYYYYYSQYDSLPKTLAEY
jgi:hypothetical protein